MNKQSKIRTNPIAHQHSHALQRMCFSKLYTMSITTYHIIDRLVDVFIILALPSLQRPCASSTLKTVYG